VIDILGLPAAEGRRSIRVWGIGGETARGNYDHPIWHYGWKTPSFAKRFLGSKLLERSELFTPEPAATASKFLDQWMDQKLDEGCPVADIPDVFYAAERVRRWAGSNTRKARSHMDLFAPLCTRPFVEAAFGLSAPLRFSEPIHYQLLRLNPELHGIPFSSEPWRNQNPNLSMPQMIWEKKIRRVPPTHPAATAYQEILLERKLQDVRDYCLSDRDSHIWHYVRRPQFESLISSDSPPGTRKSQVSLILQIVTLFRYEQLLRGMVNERQAL
jgi:asparagine synthase (glutamine-hydrolysing)